MEMIVMSHIQSQYLHQKGTLDQDVDNGDDLTNFDADVEMQHIGRSWRYANLTLYECDIVFICALYAPHYASNICNSNMKL